MPALLVIVMISCQNEEIVPLVEEAKQASMEYNLDQQSQEAEALLKIHRMNSDSRFSYTPPEYLFLDPFADDVVTNGVIDEGQCCQVPTGLIGPWPLLEAGASAGVQLGNGGFVVMDMGYGEEIVQGKGPDLMVVEFDGTLLGGGVGGLAEAYSVWVSNSSEGPFVKLGEAIGTGFFELAGKGLSSARYVKINDEGGGSRGADPHALVALNMANARFKIMPPVLMRGQKGPLMARLQFKKPIQITSASIVVIANIGQLPPTNEVPYTTDLNIEGRLQNNGTLIQFNRRDFLEAAPDGDNLVVALKIITRSGEIKYLFDLVKVVSERSMLP